MNFRVKEYERNEFHAAAAVKGLKASSLFHMFLVKTVREARSEDPEEFERKLREVAAQLEEEDNITTTQPIKGKVIGRAVDIPAPLRKVKSGSE